MIAMFTLATCWEGDATKQSASTDLDSLSLCCFWLFLLTFSLYQVAAEISRGAICNFVPNSRRSQDDIYRFVLAETLDVGGLLLRKA